jgi:DNA-binding winged helix-turn-helix (wHTH) protein
VRYRFSNCVLDGEARELRREGAVVPLSPQALQLLLRLLEARPRALPQAELRDALWPGAHVGYTSLARVVCDVRRAIGDAARPFRLVRTVPRFGYAFAAVADAEAADAGSVARALVADGHEYMLTEGVTLVGRGVESGAKLPSARVSRVHARVTVQGPLATVEDLASKNGTWVNGVRVAGPVALRDGDEVAFGTERLVYRSRRPDDVTRSGIPF